MSRRVEALGTQPAAGRRGPCLPLDLRINLYREVLQLRKKGLTYSQTIARIHSLNGVRLHDSHISRWTSGRNTPLGNVNRFDAKPSRALAYIIGVKAGDGYLCNCGYARQSHEFHLGTIDYDFAVETGRNLAKLLRRKEPFQPRWDRSHRRWDISCCSILLHRFLQHPREKLRPYIEHCRGCVAAFLRAFFDSEGSITGRRVSVANTDIKLLLYVQKLLQRHFGIETTKKWKSTEVGHRFRDPRNGKTYKCRKSCYAYQIRAQSLPLFKKYIGFCIRRKQRNLINATRTWPSLPLFLF